MIMAQNEETLYFNNTPVSYTHLDVYKRQVHNILIIEFRA